MPKSTFMLTILSLFTDQERALEIEGDFLEETKIHGRLWLVFQLIQTTLILYWDALLKSPLSTILISALIADIYVLSFIQLLQKLDISPIQAMTYIFFIYMMTGLVIENLFPKRGMKIVSTSAFFTLLLWTGLIISTTQAISIGQYAMAFFSAFVLVILMTTLPVLSGGIISAHLKQLRTYRKAKI